MIPEIFALVLVGFREQEVPKTKAFRFISAHSEARILKTINQQTDQVTHIASFVTKSYIQMIDRLINIKKGEQSITQRRARDEKEKIYLCISLFPV